MKHSILRADSIRLGAVLLTLTLALGFALARYMYVHRQAVFVEAALGGNLSRMKVMYALGVDVNAAGCEYRSCVNALWGAAYGGYDDEIRFLVDHGADVNAKPKFETTPLMVAAYHGHESTVRLLLSKGAHVNDNRDDDTALSFARDKGHPEIVELLRQAGARDAR